MSLSATDYDLITLGETMLRLSPPGYTLLEQARTLEANVGGTESNVAVALARLGWRVAWWSALPDNALGHQVANTLRAFAVDVSAVCWRADARLGTYYVEFGSPPRAAHVIYDRRDSAASHMRPEEFDWSRLRRTGWLHLTGITPALSATCLETTRHAVAVAQAAGVTISFDVNYRAKLWTWAQARPIIDELAAQASYVIIGERDAHGLQGSATPPAALPAQLHARWKHPTVIVTRSEQGAAAFDGCAVHEVAAFPVQIIDRIGAGDAFAAGLIHALLDDRPLAQALRYGTALAALKMTMPGDIALVPRERLEQLVMSEQAHMASDVAR